MGSVEEQGECSHKLMCEHSLMNYASPFFYMLFSRNGFQVFSMFPNHEDL